MEISGERISLHLCIIITMNMVAKQRYKTLTYKVIHKTINSIDWNTLIKEYLAVQEIITIYEDSNRT